MAQGEVPPEQYCGAPQSPPPISSECQPRCPDQLCTLEMGTAWAQGVALLCQLGCHSSCHKGLHKPWVIPTCYLPFSLFFCVRHGRAVRCILERGEDMLITAGRHPYLGKYKVSRREGGFVLYVYSCCNVP